MDNQIAENRADLVKDPYGISAAGERVLARIRLCAGRRVGLAMEQEDRAL